MKNYVQFGFASALAMGLSSSALAATIHVPDEQPTIQDAVDVANEGDEIVVDPGSWAGFTIGFGTASSLTVRSTDPGDPETVVSTVITTPSSILDVDATISGVTFADITGSALSVGSNIDVTITHCSFVGNTATSGSFPTSGAISSTETFLKIADCAFIRNSGENGGAIGLSNAEAEIFRCTFIGNESSFSGGAIFSTTPEVFFVVDNCSFQGNASKGDGGAIYLDTSVVPCTVRDSVFTGNRAANGGAISASFSAEINLSRTTLSANTASGSGGGLFVAPGSTATTSETVICANLPDQVAGTVSGTVLTSDYCPPPSLSPPFVSPTNCLADLTGPDGRPDGRVGFDDLTLLLGTWGLCPDC